VQGRIEDGFTSPSGVFVDRPTVDAEIHCPAGDCGDRDDSVTQLRLEQSLACPRVEDGEPVWPVGLVGRILQQYAQTNEITLYTQYVRYSYNS
jgi:hypothetical protein